jgi:hypothetical protein
MVTVAIGALQLEYLVKVLYRGRSGSRYIFTDSDSIQNSFRLRLHSTDHTDVLSDRRPHQLLALPVFTNCAMQGLLLAPHGVSVPVWCAACRRKNHGVMNDK